jgi:hypothetical protein
MESVPPGTSYQVMDNLVAMTGKYLAAHHQSGKQLLRHQQHENQLMNVKTNKFKMPQIVHY